MLTLVNVGVVCGAAYLGAQIMKAYQKHHQPIWLNDSNRNAMHHRASSSTQVYIVRSWKERNWRSRTSTRYALEESWTGRRQAYSAPEALLERLSAELVRGQVVDEATDLTGFALRPALAV